MRHCSHARKRIAEGRAANVDECVGCGTLHVTIGALSLRLDPEALASVSRTLEDALAHLLAERASATLGQRMLS